MTPIQQKKLEEIQKTLNNYRSKRFDKSFKNSKDVIGLILAAELKGANLDEMIQKAELSLNKSFRD